MIYKFKEIWKTVVIDGVEHPRYQVSNLGRVKCLNWNRTGKPRICRLYVDEDGYFRVGIDGVPKRVHRIVAEAFIPNPEGKLYIDHIDTNRKNNCIRNLRWVTAEENNKNPITMKKYIDNAYKHWRGKFGVEHSRSIPIVQLALNGQFLKKWACGMDVHRELGISCGNITNCCHGRCKSAGGFRWMYYSDWLKTRRKKSLKDIKPLFV